MKWMLTGVAALAMAASGALAQPGGGNGNGNGNGSNNVRPAAERPERGAAAERGPAARREERGNQGQGQMRQADARDGGLPDDRGNGNDRAMAEQRGNERETRGNGPAMARGNDRPASGNRPADRGRADGDRDWREPPLRYIVRDDRAGPARPDGRYLGILDGCPPGLAAKNNGCQPPGQARKTDWLVRDRYDLGWWGLPRYDSGYYRYNDGYLLRLGDGGLVSGFIPLLGGALAVGNPWPQSYGYERLDPYYADYYGLGPSYRYADNVVYRVDPETSLISSIAALLTGDEFAVGSPLPSGYDVYNVPYDYRDRYYDTDDAYYRYSDGYVYEVDPTTQLIVAAIELLA